MTLQQLKYIVAIDRQRNFAKAAEQCGISQPTLSAMLVKLEEELDVRIFERSNKLVTPTAAGEKIIRQAEKALAEAERITELVAEDKGAVNGELALSVGPTIAPYILPKFIRHYVENYPTVKLSHRKTFYPRDEGRRDAQRTTVGASRCWHCHQRQFASGHPRNATLHGAFHGLSG